MTKRASFEPSPYRRRLLFEPLEDRRLLSITVNTLVDENDGIAVGGISLRDAIAAASPGDTINFAPSLTAAGPATILLTHGELAITKSLAINGPGASLLTIDASGNDPTPYNALPVPAFETSSDGTRVFRIDDGNVSEQDVSINGLKISGGDVPGDGGGILNYEQLAIVSCEISNNIADGSGGGIANRGDAVMTRCTLANDASRTNGGGASNTRALTILSSEVFDNRFVDPFFLVLADGRGGGIFTSGSLTITRSTISGNSSIRGAGISATGTASVSMFQSTLSNNYAGYDGSTFAQRGAGGGVYAETGSIIQAALCTFSYNHADAKGAGLFLNYARLSLTNCTITGNSGSQSGAGLYIAASDLAPAEISYATISSNRSSNGANGNTSGGGIFLAAGNLHIVSTIIAQNMADDGPDLNNNLNALFDSTYCLVGDGAKSGLAEAQVGSPDAKGNLVGGLAHGLIDPHLSSLADHGGPTWTMFLLSGSPAIDTGNPVAVAGAGTVPQFDQRGAPFSRVAGGRIDIGATERQTVSSLNLVVDTLDDESDGNYTSGDLSLREAIGLANGSVGTNTVSFALSLYSDGPITIPLTLGVLKLDESATILSPNASLISLDGSKNKRSHKEVHDVAQGAEAFEIVQYYAFTPVQVEIDRLTITKFGAQNFSYDAAIQNSANVTISGCNITNNFNIGIRNFATLGITDSTISNNMAQGIINDGQCAITSSTISGNITDSAGGGIFNSSGSMTITDSTISGNQAKYSGGGIYSATNLIATNVTISSNSSSQNGGGIFLGNSASFSPIINLSFCSISNNFAALGGGLFLALGAASLNSSIVADNYYGIAPDLARLIGTDITTKYCLIGSNAGSGLTEAPTGSPDTNGNLIGGSLHGPIDPKLGQLANNGGKTLTCALLNGSPAIGAGDPVALAGVNNVPQFDQRGTPFGRVYGGRIDMGAIEFRPPLPGDYNSDGTVDAADYTVWRDTLGSTTDLRADSSGPTVGTPDNIIDQADYDFWKAHFGIVSTGGGGGNGTTTALAEPVALSLHQAESGISATTLDAALDSPRAKLVPDLPLRIVWLPASARQELLLETWSATRSDKHHWLDDWADHLWSHEAAAEEPPSDVAAAVDSAFGLLGFAAEQ